LSQAIQDYLGIFGASLIVGLKLQQQVSHQSQQAVHPRRNVLNKPETTNVGSLLQNHGWISPFFLRASPTLQASNRLPQIAESPSVSEDSIKSLSDKIREYKKDFKKLTREYVQGIRTHIGVALLTSKNGEEGIKFLKANEKTGRTLYNLAVAYETGQHVSGNAKPDLFMAFEYYERAARLNHKFATYNLALFYLYGKGPVSVDLEKGTALLETAHKLGVEEASIFVDFKNMIEKSRIEVPVTPSRESNTKLQTSHIRSSSSAPDFSSSQFSSSSASSSDEGTSMDQAFLKESRTSESQPIQVRWALCF
jgi:hypothetical protein